MVALNQRGVSWASKPETVWFSISNPGLGVETQHVRLRVSLYGFDSFEGLSESWNIGAKVGHFSTDGIVPEIDDSRIHYHKGRFPETPSGI
jgi:hypothetical protein